MNLSVDGSAYNNGINNANIGNDRNNTASINIAENKKKGAAQIDFQGVVVSGMNVDAKAMDRNTYDSLIKEADDVKAQIMQSASNAKIGLKALFNRINESDAVKINEDGFNLDDLSEEDCVNIVDRIRIQLAAYNDNYRVFAGDIDVDKIEQVVESKGFAQDIAGKMADSGVPATDENIEAVGKALKDIPSENRLSDEEKLYMVAGNMEPTLTNIKMAQSACNMSVSYNHSTPLTEASWQQLKPQIEKIITKAGLSLNEKNINNAKAMLERDIPVTEDNLQKMAEMDEIELTPENVVAKVIDAISKGQQPEKAVMSDHPDMYKEVARALDTLEKADELYLAYAGEHSDNGIVSLRTIEEAINAFADDEQVQPVSDIINQEIRDSGKQSGQEAGNQGNSQNNSNYRTLLQIQILMTAETGVSLVKSGVDINQVSIGTLHKHLLALDKENVFEQIGEQLSRDIDSDEFYSTTLSVRESIYNIKNAPLDTVAVLYKEILAKDAGSITITSAASMGISLKQRLSMAGEAYDTMSTSVRKDMGDSLNRAVESSAQAMLNDMDMEDNSQNRQAVAILAKNGMDITRENVINIRELKSTLDSIVDNMKPQTVLNMIRDNVDIMSADIHAVNQYLKEEYSDISSASAYSTFLYKLDRTNGITSEERQQFIGIYKMMNMFTKDAGSAIGALVKQGADITMKNLCSAYDSRRSYNNMDMSVDDSKDVTVSVYESLYTNIFAKTGGKITPLTLENVNEEKPIMSRSVDNFCEAAQDMYDAKAEAAYMDEYMKLVRQVAAADSAVINELERSGEDITINNIQAMEQLMMSDLFNNSFRIDREKAQDFLDNIGDREELTSAVRQLCDEADRRLGEEIDKADNSYEVAKKATIDQMSAGIMVRSAARQDYTIPYIKGDGYGMMKLTFKAEEGDKGKIAISYEDDRLGRVNVEINVTSDELMVSGTYGTRASITGTADSEEADSAAAFRERLNAVADEVKEQFGFRKTNVIINPVRNVSRNLYGSDDTGIDTKKLYKIAKTVVSGLV
ncbi:MAG: DUF6240 domain-containing protein [Clostridia bacterium]|nr:DUF6240 domain-containing protein [Clostridia bacterium]